jgi:hypothetical protein
MYHDSLHGILSGGSWAAFYFKGDHCTSVFLLLNCKPIRTIIAEGTSAVYSGQRDSIARSFT